MFTLLIKLGYKLIYNIYHRVIFTLLIRLKYKLFYNIYFINQAKV